MKYPSTPVPRGSPAFARARGTRAEYTVTSVLRQSGHRRKPKNPVANPPGHPTLKIGPLFVGFSGSQLSTLISSCERNGRASHRTRNICPRWRASTPMSTRTCPGPTGTTTALISVSPLPAWKPFRGGPALDLFTDPSIFAGWGVLENYEVVRKIGSFCHPPSSRSFIVLPPSFSHAYEMSRDSLLTSSSQRQAGASTRRFSKALTLSTTKNASSRC